ncbi:MAG TPA: hypothetical protein VET23_12505, partial [Chitinophagaceae bacterium]|nr:hypothetical protein [Chitinophagaceae bacterium]
FHSDIFRNVTNYQFIQHKKGETELLLTVTKDFQTSEIGLIHKEIDKKTKGVIDFHIKVVPGLKLSPRGKFQMFISSIANE